MIENEIKIKKIKNKKDYFDSLVKEEKALSKKIKTEKKLMEKDNQEISKIQNN